MHSPNGSPFVASLGCRAFPRRRLCCPTPAGGTMPRSDSLSVGSGHPEEGLTSSTINCHCIPRPLRRRVLCPVVPSRVPSSSPFPWPSPSLAGLGSLLFPFGVVYRRGRLRLMLRTAVLLASLQRLCQQASPAGFRQLRCLGAAQLPGRWVATGTGLSPASQS